MGFFIFYFKYLASNGKTRTYSPDFVVRQDNILIEIKPEKMHTNKDILSRLLALQKCHPNMSCQLWGLKKIGEFVRQTLENNNLESYIKSGLLCMNEKQTERLKRNYVDILRAAAQ